MGKDILLLKDISKTYHQGGQTLSVLKNVNLRLQEGQIIGLMGASGSGKSTLLHIAGLLMDPSNGRIELQGESCLKEKSFLRAHKLGFVYQFHYLLPELSAIENVALPLRMQGCPKVEALSRAADLLKEVGLSKRLKHIPSELSGGEQQRCAIARAIVHQPILLLADEPTGNLDHTTALAVFDLLVAQSRSRNMAALIATHDVSLASRMDAVVYLTDGCIADPL